jgi:uncharacterized protein YkwD
VVSSSRRLRTGAALLLAVAALLCSIADGRHFHRTVTAVAARLGARDDQAIRAPAPTRAGSQGPSAEQVLEAMNAYRKSHGLLPLRLDARLTAAATDRLRDMFGRKYFDHVAPDGTSPDSWVRRRGYRYTIVAENLARGHESAREVVDEWMRSAHHSANILGEYEDAGVAFASGSPTEPFEGYTFVVLYATASHGTGPVGLDPAVRLARGEAQTASSRARRPGPCPATIAA